MWHKHLYHLVNPKKRHCCFLLYLKQVFFVVFEQWLQNVIALQCSIMRHLKQKVSSASSTLSSGSPAEWVCEQKASTKPCATSEDLKPRESLERTTPSDPCSKPCAAPDIPSGALLSGDSLTELALCKCSMIPCQNCRKPNGPVAEECQPPKANGPVDCNSSSDSCRQLELQHRLKPSTAPPESAAALGLANHIGTEMIKKEPESMTEDCTQKNVPAAPTIWPHGSQAELQEGMSCDEKTCADAPPKGNLEHSAIKTDTSAPTSGRHFLSC